MNETGENVSIDALIESIKQNAADADKMIFIHEGSNSGKVVDCMLKVHAYLITDPANCCRIDVKLIDLKTNTIIEENSTVVQEGSL